MKKRMSILLVPREYVACSAEEMMIKTEKMYEQAREIYIVVDREKEKYRIELDAMLQLVRKPEEMLRLLDDETGKLLCTHDGEFQTFRTICQIANCEEALGESNVFQNIEGVSDSCEWLQKRVFEIRRFELEWIDDNELAELIELVSRKKISYICLAEIVHKCAIARKIQTADRLARYLYQKGCARESLLFLIWTENLLPYSEKKIMTFANTFLEMGQIRQAYEMLIKHRNPTEEIVNLQNTLEAML